MKKLGGQGRDSNPQHGYSRVPYRGTVALDHSAAYPSVVRNVVPGFDRRRAKNVVTVNRHERDVTKGYWVSIDAVGLSVRPR